MERIKVSEPPVCPHCGVLMVKHVLPPVTFADGLGWGAPFLWMCSNDDCPVFKKGFSSVMSNYGRAASMRAIVEPDTGRSSVAPAFSLDPEHIDEFLKIRDRLRKEGTPPDFNEDDLPLGSDDE